MSETSTQPPKEPVGMKIVGTGVIAACLVLSALFGWGVYLQLTEEPCPCDCPVVETEAAEQVRATSGPSSRSSGGPI